MLNDWRMYTDASGQDQNHMGWHEVLKEIAQLNGTSRTLVHAAYGDHVDLVVAEAVIRAKFWSSGKSMSLRRAITF